MTRAKGIVLAFRAFGKARKAVFLAQARHARAPSSEDFMRIGLVAHIPDNHVLRCLENGMQRHRQLDHTQRRAEMAPGARHAMHDIRAQLSRQRLKLMQRQRA